MLPGMSAAPSPPTPPGQAPPPQQWAQPAAPKPKGMSSTLKVVIVVVVAVALIGAGVGAYVLSQAASSAKTTTYSENLINTGSQSLGAGTGNAEVVSFSIPSGATSAHVTGWMNVTTCSTGGNCLAYVYVITPLNWSNLLGGGDVYVVWCYTTGTTCESLQYNDISTGDLSAYAGQTLDLVFYNTDTVFSQTYSADVTLTYST